MRHGFFSQEPPAAKQRWNAGIAVLVLCCFLVLFTGCSAESLTVGQQDETAESLGGQKDGESDSADGQKEGEADSADGQQDGESEDAKEPSGSSELQVHFINVGQGDAALITCGGHAMLIDAGDNDKGTLVQNYIRKQEVGSLDYLIGTHPDADHIGGLDVIIYKYKCGQIFLPPVENDTRTYEDVLAAIKERDADYSCPEAGSTFALGDAEFTILAPVRDYGSETNNWSIVLLLEYGSSRFLFTGDAEEEAEADILANGIDCSADVLKVSHHGSSTATSQAFLDAVDPDCAVISLGEDNSYGHPHAEVMNRLREKGVKVYRTDEQGSIVAVSDGETITWNTSPDGSWKAGEASGSGADDADADTAAPDSSITYVLNRNTKKFHLPDCSSVQEMADRNRQEVDWSRDEVTAAGYEPCKRCDP